MPNIIIRIAKILIGESSGSNYVWLDNFELKGQDKDPWIHIFIPHGLTTVHQHILSPHWEGQLKVRDLSALKQALFVQAVNGSNPAIDTNNTKWSIGYFTIYFVAQDGSTQIATLSGVKIANIEIDNVAVGKEATFLVKFTADLLKWPVPS